MKKTIMEVTPKLYINNQFIKEFNSVSDRLYAYETYFFMPEYDVTVEIKFD